MHLNRYYSLMSYSCLIMFLKKERISSMGFKKGECGGKYIISKVSSRNYLAHLDLWIEQLSMTKTKSLNKSLIE